MTTDGLSDLSGMDDKQRAVLADKLGITTGHALIMAETGEVLAAFKGRRNRPTLEDVAAWQDEARRSTASMPAIARPGWEQAAMFVVAFEHREADSLTERRVVAEHFDVESETTTDLRSEWEGWTGSDVCEWMAGRMAELAATPPDTTDEGASELTEAEPSVVTARAKLDVKSATLSDSRGDRELVAESTPVEELFPVWDGPTKLVATLRQEPVKRRTSIVLQLERFGGPKHNIVGQLDEDEQNFEFDLTSLESGEYRPTLVAKISDGSLLPCLVRLPPVEVVATAVEMATTAAPATSQ